MSEYSDLKDQLQAISTRCWKTSASRFEASRRMKRCSNASTICVSMLSLEIIVINLLIFIPSFHLDGNLVTIITVCLSAFVLVLSLIISQLKYDRREEEYHQCGIRLSALEKRINIYLASGNDIDYDVVQNFDSEYQKILRESNLNHSKIDCDQALRDSKVFLENNGNNELVLFFHNLWLDIRWNILSSHMIYHILTFLGALAIFLVVAYGKKEVSDETYFNKAEMIINNFSRT